MQSLLCSKRKNIKIINEYQRGGSYRLSSKHLSIRFFHQVFPIGIFPPGAACGKSCGKPCGKACGEAQCAGTQSVDNFQKIKNWAKWAILVNNSINTLSQKVAKGLYFTRKYAHIAPTPPGLSKRGGQNGQ